MSIYTYSLFSYLLTAGISFAVIGIIVGLTKIIGKEDDQPKED